MPISECWSAWCSSGLVVPALAALLLLPAQQYLPHFAFEEEQLAPPPAPHGTLAPPARSLWPDFDDFPTLNLIFSISLLLLALFTYTCEWIQRKLMERRIVKLNQYLGASVERLRAWDAQQEQLDATLRMAQNATSEYNLLLYLLLRRHPCLAPAPTRAPATASNCFFDKDLY